MCTEIVSDIQNNFCTQHVLPMPMFCKKKSFWQTFTCTWLCFAKIAGLQIESATKLHATNILELLLFSMKSRLVVSKRSFEIKSVIIFYEILIWFFVYQDWLAFEIQLSAHFKKFCNILMRPLFSHQKSITFAVIID